jgi:hypothetical protein
MGCKQSTAHRASTEGLAMKREQLPLYAIALAILIVGLALAGVPVGSLIVLPLILACPLMMVFMMRGMDHGTPRDRDDHAPLADPNDGREQDATRALRDETSHRHDTSTG